MNNAVIFTKEHYKAIKHMDKRELEEYLKRIYARGYREGVAAAEKQKKENEK